MTERKKKKKYTDIYPKDLDIHQDQQYMLCPSYMHMYFAMFFIMGSNIWDGDQIVHRM